MNAEQVNLMNSLKSDPKDKAPLSDIKKAMGSLRYSVGNPLSKTEISIRITTLFYDDVIGAAIPPALLPAQLKLSFPVFLFGLTDYYGFYLKSRTLVPFRDIWKQPQIVPVQFSTTFLGMAMESGDLILLYQTDPIGGVTYSCNILIHCSNIAYLTFLNSFVSDLITINVMRMVIPIANITQFLNPLVFGYQTLFGKTNSDSLDPRMYITSRDYQQQIADLPINLPIDKNMMLAFYLEYTCQQVEVILFVNKVEPLTHKTYK
jgi:hypothetical protein